MQVSDRLMDIGTEVQPDDKVHPSDVAVVRFDPPTEEDIESSDPNAVWPANVTYFVSKNKAELASEVGIDGVPTFLSCIRHYLTPI